MPTLGWASIIGLTEARTVADHWLGYVVERYGGWAGSQQPAITESEEFKGWEGELLGYKFSVQPDGHILVSLMTQLPAVKSYSETYDFDVNATGGYPALLKDTMGATLDFLKDTYGALDQLPAAGMGMALTELPGEYLHIIRSPGGRTVDA